jgi:hypothetical protein
MEALCEEDPGRAASAGPRSELNIELRIFSIEGLLQESAGLHALDHAGQQESWSFCILSWRTARCESTGGRHAWGSRKLELYFLRWRDSLADQLGRAGRAARPCTRLQEGWTFFLGWEGRLSQNPGRAGREANAKGLQVLDLLAIIQAGRWRPLPRRDEPVFFSRWRDSLAKNQAGYASNGLQESWIVFLR